MDHIEKIVTDFVCELVASNRSGHEKKMIWLHLTKPWIPNFKAPAIRPLNSNLKEYLGPVIVDDTDGHTWYFPSMKWWDSHAKRSHPPDGSGMDLDVHVNFLTVHGESSEFAYATVYQNAQLWVLQPRDFEKEQKWWRQYFHLYPDE